MRRIKIAVFSMLSILSVAALNSIKASAAAFGNIGGQSGIQTRDMTIDEGLKILGYEPSAFQMKQEIRYDDKIDLSEYYSYYNKSGNDCPFEVIGVTESYEYLEDGYIDTYVYLYTPYNLIYPNKNADGHYQQLSDGSYVYNKFSEENKNDSILLGISSMTLDVVGSNSYLKLDVNDSNAKFERAYIHTSQEPKSVSSGVTRALFRIYNASDITKERKYSFPVISYTYYNPAADKIISGSTNPRIRFTYKDKQVISSIDEDTTSSAFVVKNKSVIPVEAYSIPYHDNISPFQDKTQIYITLVNKETGEYIKNAIAIHAKYYIRNKKYDETVNIRHGYGLPMTATFSKKGNINYITEPDLYFFKKDVLPNMKESYKYDEYPEYVWTWNWWVADFSIFYILCEVEKGTVVQGSCYENGLHVEYDDNGKPLGVYDKDGNKYSNIKYDENGCLLNDDGTVRSPENSHTADDVIAKKDHESILDKAKDMVDKAIDAVKDSLTKLKEKLTGDKNKYFIIGGIALGVIVIASVITNKGKKE